MTSIKRKLKTYLGPTLQKLGHMSGLMQTIATIRQTKGAIVLMYHSVAPPSTSQWIDPRNQVPAEIFKQQMTFLAEKRNVISLEKLICTLKKKETPPNGTIVITFDDGYLNNLTIAAPILTSLNLQATLFLPTGYIDRGETQWIDQIYSTFKYRDKQTIRWPDKNGLTLNLSDQQQFEKAYNLICTYLLSATPTQRTSTLKSIRDQLQPSVTPPRLTMNWDEINTLLTSHNCFTLGGHTIEHTDMTSIAKKEASIELIKCSDNIQRKIGVPPCSFSFPYGRTSVMLQQITKLANYKTAFSGSLLDPVINSNHNIFALPRIKGPPTMKRFNTLTLSANTGIWRKFAQ